MLKPSYHLHLDAALLPTSLMNKLIHEGGFQLDDFPHQLVIEGESYSARHMTKYLYAPITPVEVKEECLRLKSWVEESTFKGLIQCEFIMEESHWTGLKVIQEEVPPPFFLNSRMLSSKRGDRFKKHELHLELIKSSTSERITQALRGCGMHILENEADITFTCCGDSRELLKVRAMLNSFISEHSGEISGKLTYEATAFWSLHGLRPESLPQIVDRVKVLQ